MLAGVTASDVVDPNQSKTETQLQDISNAFAEIEEG